MSRGADLVTGWLPDYARESMRELTDIAGAQLDPALAFLDRADPTTSPSGTCQLTDPATAEHTWLPWLAWLVGLDLGPLAESDYREAITESVTHRLRGTEAAMIAAVQGTLVDSRTVTINRALEGDPYMLGVYVYTSETPDPDATLAAALREKPAGVALTLTIADGMSYVDLGGEYATYDVMAATGLTYDDLAHLE